jgi:hypothetical protein
MNILAQSSTQIQPVEQLEKPRADVRSTEVFHVDDYRLMTRSEITDAWLMWIAHIPWRSMITLTLKDEHIDMKQETLINSWLRLVRYINKEVFGNNYTRIVHHSYFSYLVGIEKQKRGALHLHVLVDRPVPFDYIRKMWCAAWGLGWVGIDKISNDIGACEYLTKYVAKGGELIPYTASDFTSSHRITPKRTFSWWYE